MVYSLRSLLRTLAGGALLPLAAVAGEFDFDLTQAQSLSPPVTCRFRSVRTPEVRFANRLRFAESSD